ncbi:DUF1398 family protein [Reyranella sp.]|jgi:uncharacterized protein YbcV (DUF1398 family)|uniref:DUF1398 domain-containing protein n=1 Tax=Reyranella sp. TaxID=1929291 RepID=UPI000BD4D660|nr:DUF1398 family protein [Reyranella sp.]OYY40295.1 MAG: DUF1398 domain-containing protein [Rhodospirillales bacterium 35-66-84]OYZ92847.1 MAG: DUF1398 domain-containing protein [Rhodospirillales bacterium 24-66-33]OZB22568.1 MAG: DUF1398 domain-containing protein [Rhodospirillales bacterium 39-66-50]HQS18910.1 DUF1398 family protein [Reyranella sp.]HQT12321.1 DUF1398 family protein [Reyranella sp.]
MDIAVIEECTRASHEERITFGEVVGRLIAAGVERYHVDLVRGDSTYFMPDDRSHRVTYKALGTRPADAFTADGVLAAVRAIQAGKTKYLTFCRQIMEAGCVGYLVSMQGQRAVYYGRSGETYVEPFPAAP